MAELEDPELNSYGHTKSSTTQRTIFFDDSCFPYSL